MPWATWSGRGHSMTTEHTAAPLTPAYWSGLPASTLGASLCVVQTTQEVALQAIHGLESPQVQLLQSLSSSKQHQQDMMHTLSQPICVAATLGMRAMHTWLKCCRMQQMLHQSVSLSDILGRQAVQHTGCRQTKQTDTDLWV